MKQWRTIREEMDTNLLVRFHIIQKFAFFTIMKIMNILKRFLLSASLLCIGIQSFAQEGRWYSLDESTPSTPSGFGAIICLVIGLICGFCLIALVLSDDSNKDGKGCLVGFILIIIVAGIIAAASLF